MSSFWKCKSCGTLNQRVKQRCTECLAARPKRRRPAHLTALDKPYEWFVAEYGEACGICSREPSEGRRLDRDHDHRDGGSPRGLLCHRCNRALPNWITTEWLDAAHRYLSEHEARQAA